jgi:hypothetical protein
MMGNAFSGFCSVQKKFGPDAKCSGQHPKPSRKLPGRASLCCVRDGDQGSVSSVTPMVTPAIDFNQIRRLDSMGKIPLRGPPLARSCFRWTSPRFQPGYPDNGRLPYTVSHTVTVIAALPFLSCTKCPLPKGRHGA